MQRFHNLGLIETNADHFLIIKEKKLTDYLLSSPNAGNVTKLRRFMRASAFYRKYLKVET